MQERGMNQTEVGALAGSAIPSPGKTNRLDGFAEYSHAISLDVWVMIERLENVLSKLRGEAESECKKQIEECPSGYLFKIQQGLDTTSSHLVSLSKLIAELEEMVG